MCDKAEELVVAVNLFLCRKGGDKLLHVYQPHRN